MITATSADDDVERLQARITAMEQERRQLLAVIEILQEIGGSLQFGDIVQSVASRMGEAFGLDRCSIFLAERGGATVRLVASYEDPAIRNYVVDLDRYPELRRAIQSGETVFIADAAADPSLEAAQGALAARGVKTITVVPITWRRASIGAIVLRTFRDGPAFSEGDVQFCRVVANLTAKALRNALRFERLQERQGDGAPARGRERDQTVLLAFMKKLLDSYPGEGESDGGADSTAELDRLVGVARTVLTQEAAGR